MNEHNMIAKPAAVPPRTAQLVNMASVLTLLESYLRLLALMVKPKSPAPPARDLVVL